jgi:hypothetical protein
METALQLLKILADQGVEFIVVGGVAGAFHGSPLNTLDLDVFAPMTPENIAKMSIALRPLHPRHPMHPKLPPLSENPEELKGFKNIYLKYLKTDLGQLDVLGELTGVGDCATALQHSILADMGGFTCRFLDLDALIAA